MQPNASKNGRRVLIVDDSAAAAEIAARLIIASGDEADIARDGFEAIMRLQSRAYSAVLLDYVMPGMDGVEVMNWIRRRIVSPPPVHVVSSEDPDLLQRRFRGLGVKGFISKPVTAAALCRALAMAA